MSWWTAPRTRWAAFCGAVGFLRSAWAAAGEAVVDPGGENPFGVSVAVGYGLVWAVVLLLLLSVARGVGQANRELSAIERRLEGDAGKRETS
jgi:uncharacterized membrane protein